MSDIYLYPTSEKDFEDYYLVRSDPDDVYWNGYSSAPEKESFREGFLKRTANARFEEPEDRRNYLIKETESGLTVGFVQLIRRENAVEIGYSVSHSFQGRGYATQALNLGIELAKEFVLPIIVSIREDNIPSQRVAIKNGFKKRSDFKIKNCYKAGEVKLFKYILE